LFAMAKRLHPFCVVAALASFHTTAQAQSVGDVAAAGALQASHIGALTPLMSPAMIRRTLNGAQLGLRYGLRDEPGLRTHSVAGTGIFAMGLNSSVAITAGVADADCMDGCSPALLLGIGADMRVFERGDVLTRGSIFTLVVSGDVGYAEIKPSDNDALGLGIGAPMTLVLGADRAGWRLTSFFTPVFGIGQLNGLICPDFGPCNDSASGTRIVLGGGVGLWSPMSSVSASVGINQVMADAARPVFGVSVVIGGR
jgi:hypothetical protein